MDIRFATAADLDALVPLFDGYRQFYKFASDIEGGRTFLSARFDAKDSVILIAEHEGAAIGFTQLFPSFSSGRMARIFVLNDLFVAPGARGAGVGRALLEAARDYGIAQGAVRLTLSTQVENKTAQALYEAAGWKRDTAFFVYNFPLV